MKRLCLAFLLLASIAKAETDTRAFGAINDIQKGRHNQNAIEDLYVTDDGLIRDDLTVLGDEIVGGNLVVTGTVTSTGSSSGGNATFNNITVRTNSTVLGSQIVGVVSGKVTVETKDFLPLVAMVFTYYFTKYSKDSSQSSEKKETFLDDRGA